MPPVHGICRVHCLEGTRSDTPHAWLVRRPPPSAPRPGSGGRSAGIRHRRRFRHARRYARRSGARSASSQPSGSIARQTSHTSSHVRGRGTPCLRVGRASSSAQTSSPICPWRTCQTRPSSCIASYAGRGPSPPSSHRGRRGSPTAPPNTWAWCTVAMVGATPNARAQASILTGAPLTSHSHGVDMRLPPPRHFGEIDRDRVRAPRPSGGAPGNLANTSWTPMRSYADSLEAGRTNSKSRNCCRGTRFPAGRRGGVGRYRTKDFWGFKGMSVPCGEAKRVR
jgi:hypothetical protein